MCPVQRQERQKTLLHCGQMWDGAFTSKVIAIYCPAKIPGYVLFGLASGRRFCEAGLRFPPLPCPINSSPPSATHHREPHTTITATTAVSSCLLTQSLYPLATRRYEAYIQLHQRRLYLPPIISIPALGRVLARHPKRALRHVPLLRQGTRIQNLAGAYHEAIKEGEVQEAHESDEEQGHGYSGGSVV